jgi:hypothetical protein
MTDIVLQKAKVKSKVKKTVPKNHPYLCQAILPYRPQIFSQKKTLTA